MKALLLQQRCAKALDECWGLEVDTTKRIDKIEIVRSTLFLHLSNSVIGKVGETKIAAKPWKKLDTLYETTTLPNNCYLWKQIFGFKFDPHADLEINLNKFSPV